MIVDTRRIMNRKCNLINCKISRAERVTFWRRPAKTELRNAPGRKSETMLRRNWRTEDKFNFLPAKIKSHMCRLQPAQQQLLLGAKRRRIRAVFLLSWQCQIRKIKLAWKGGGCGRVIAQSTNVGAIDNRKLKNCKLRYAGMIDWYSSSKSNCHF